MQNAPHFAFGVLACCPRVAAAQTRSEAPPQTANRMFPNAAPVPGVTDNGDAATRPIPTFGMKNGQSKLTGREVCSCTHAAEVFDDQSDASRATT